MTLIAAWLLAVGVGDLARPGGALRRRRGRAVACGLLLLVLLAVWLLCGRPAGRGSLVWVVLGGLGVGWVLLSARAVEAGLTTALGTGPLGAASPSARARPLAGWVRPAALSCLAGGVLLALALNGLAPAPSGPVARWYSGLGLASLRGVPLGRALTALGVLLVQVGTANVVVRLGLDAAGARSEPGVLRGGRLLGPLERLFVVGLGLAGQVTAASVVIAAKGVLRFPELSKQGTAHQRIDAVTEYFLVGSFLSWLVAMLGIVLARA